MQNFTLSSETCNNKNTFITIINLIFKFWEEGIMTLFLAKNTFSFTLNEFHFKNFISKINNYKIMTMDVP